MEIERDGSDELNGRGRDAERVFAETELSLLESIGIILADDLEGLTTGDFADAEQLV